MGLTNRSSATYVSIYKGKVTIRVPKGTPDSVTRTNKVQKEVSELQYDQIEGELISFNHRTNAAYNTIELLIDLEDAGRKYQIQVQWSSRYTREFFNVCHNIDITKPVTFRPYRFTPTDQPDKIISGWKLIQGGKNLLPKFARGQLPELEKIKYKGQDQWDDTEQMQFLWTEAWNWGSKIGLFNTVAEITDDKLSPEDDIPEDFR